MENQPQAQPKVKKPKLWLIVVAVALILVIAVFVMFQATGSNEPSPEVVTVSTLEKIINVNELSTFTAVYNGIAEIMNEKKSEEIDYYVSYEAVVKAGIDLEKIVVSVNNETKAITIDIPEVYITDIDVEIASLDFIFYNEKSNDSTVSQGAFNACKADVQMERPLSTIWRSKMLLMC